MTRSPSRRLRLWALAASLALSACQPTQRPAQPTTLPSQGSGTTALAKAPPAPALTITPEAPVVKPGTVPTPVVETPSYSVVPETPSKPQVTPPEIKAPEVKVPEVKVPEVKVPEVKAPEVTAPEKPMIKPEVTAPELPKPEVKAPEVKVPEVKVPEVKVPEVKAPEVKVPEVKVPEVKAPEVTAPEKPMIKPEVTVPELPKPEIKVPEIPKPEIVKPELPVVKPEVPSIAPPVLAGLAVDAKLPDYAAQEKLTGRLRSVGSDTMDRLTQLWSDEFTKTHPGLRVFHEGKGSSNAPPALAEGLADVGPMSRPIKEDEVKMLNTRFGFNPTQVRVAVDALAIYVHPSNPIAQRGLTLAELDAIYSSNRKRGHPKDIATWGDLGLTGEWANRPVIVFSRNKASGTYGFFRDEALKKGDFKTTNREMVGSEAVVAGVAENPGAIGYSGIAYKNDKVFVAPLRAKEGAEAFLPEPEFAYSGQYPLARGLYLTLAVKPGTTLKPLHREFLRYVFSRQGQQQVAHDGYFPLDAKAAADELAKLGL
jgi:phosphate transport system substrate-binding protein